MDLAKLKAAALAATQDGWEMKYLGSQIGLRVRSGYQCFFNIKRPNSTVEKEAVANAVFFYSAQPAAVLELIALVERQEAELAAARAPVEQVDALTDEQIAEIGRPFMMKQPTESDLEGYIASVRAVIAATRQAGPVQAVPK